MNRRDFFKLASLAVAAFQLSPTALPTKAKRLVPRSPAATSFGTPPTEYTLSCGGDTDYLFDGPEDCIPYARVRTNEYIQLTCTRYRDPHSLVAPVVLWRAYSFAELCEVEGIEGYVAGILKPFDSLPWYAVEQSCRRGGSWSAVRTAWRCYARDAG